MKKSYVLAVLTVFYFSLAPAAYSADCAYQGGKLEDLLDRIDKATATMTIFSNATDQVYLDCLLTKNQEDEDSLSEMEKKIVDAWHNLQDRELQVDEFGKPF